MRRGAVVMIGENRGPEFRVEHIAFGMAWVYPHGRAGTADDHAIVPVSRLREVGSVFR